MPEQIGKLFGQYESYVALTRTAIGMRRHKWDLVVGFLSTAGIDIKERIQNKPPSMPSKARQ